MGATQPRVLMDATSVPPDRRGVGTYVDAILPALERRGTPLVIVCRAGDGQHYATLCPTARIRVAPETVDRRPVRLAWEQVGLARLIAQEKPDVVHSPHYTRPLAVRRPVLVTLHDATFFTHPDVHVPVKRAFFKTWTRASLRLADRCIVPSAATRDELVRVAGAQRDRIDVVHLGVDEATFHPPTKPEIAAAAAHLGLGDRPYVAFLGTLEPRKNIPNLIRAFTGVVSGRDNQPALVIAGGSGWDESLEAQLDALPSDVEVIRPGFLPLEMLRGYLGGATVVAYPSLGEGFGLPVLEGMACGAAVLTTPHLALAEVGGDAVEYTSTVSGSIERVLRSLLESPERRRELSERGLRRAKLFSWDNAAEAHQQIYRELAEGVR